MCGFPQIVAAIDGTHININRPKEIHAQGEYYNRKLKHSFNVQICVDPWLNVVDLYSPSPGSFHDARVFRRSGLWELLRTNQICNGPSLWFSNRLLPQVILGDSGYPNQLHLVTPFKSDATQGTESQRRKFNKKISKARVRVEHAIGCLKLRFPMLKNRLHVRRKNVQTIVWACCVLHNFINACGVPPPPTQELEEFVEGENNLQEVDVLGDVGGEDDNTSSRDAFFAVSQWQG